MFAGKTKAALDLLSQAQKGGVLHLNDPSDLNNPDSPTVRDMLNWCQCHPFCCPVELLGQQDPLVLMSMNGDACPLPSRVHLPTCATHLPWWQKGFAHPMWIPNVFLLPLFLPPDCPGQKSCQTNNCQSNTHCNIAIPDVQDTWMPPAVWWADFWDWSCSACCTDCLWIWWEWSCTPSQREQSPQQTSCPAQYPKTLPTPCYHSD